MQDPSAARATPLKEVQPAAGSAAGLAAAFAAVAPPKEGSQEPSAAGQATSNQAGGASAQCLSSIAEEP
eukprot:13150419-Heterocapsa_arctica.AAC.1